VHRQPRRHLGRHLLAFGIVGATVFSGLAPNAIPVAKAASQPDVIVIVTDDQRWDGMGAMPLTRSWLPTNYTQAFVSNPSCCPSRTTILTSTYSHTNGVWANSAPYGGWPAFEANGWAGRTIADALQGTGYRTALFGKFLNGWDGTMPPGWDQFAAHIRTGAFPGAGKRPYYDYTLRQLLDGVVTDVNYGEQPSDYSTDVIDRMAVEFVHTTPADQPLFLYYAPPAPHSAGPGRPPIPAPLDENAPITLQSESPNVNESDVTDKPEYIQRRALRDLTDIEARRTAIDRSLMSVDRSVDHILSTIERERDLSNTLVLFLSDNGLAVGSHRWMAKGVPYDEAIRIPILARFDGRLPQGDQDRLVDNLDIAPTIAEATGISFPAEGLSLLGSVTRDHLVIEGGVGGNHAFCGVRSADAKYVKYISGQEEYYDLVVDPYELSNDPSNPAASELRRFAEVECSPLPPTWPRTTL
jgi:arylsulfatase A-like enzyme